MIEGTAKKEGIPLLRKDVYICNVVKCRPPENRTPEPDEMEICGQFLYRQLSAIQPKAICALGGTAARARDRHTKKASRKMRGKWFKWRDIPVMVTYHPSYLLRPYNQNAKREAWEDLKKVLHFVYDYSALWSPGSLRQVDQNDIGILQKAVEDDLAAIACNVECPHGGVIPTRAAGASSNWPGPSTQSLYIIPIFVLLRPPVIKKVIFSPRAYSDSGMEKWRCPKPSFSRDWKRGWGCGARGRRLSPLAPLSTAETSSRQDPPRRGRETAAQELAQSCARCGMGAN